MILFFASDLNVSLTAKEVKDVLETLAGIGKLDVQKNGTCANFDLAATFLTLPGDLQEMTVCLTIEVYVYNT